jgi:hypothetical protein
MHGGLNYESNAHLIAKFGQVMSKLAKEEIHPFFRDFLIF